MATMKKTDVKKRGKIGYGQYWQSELYEEVMNTYRAIDDTVDSIGRIINEMQTQTGRNWDTEPDVPKWFVDVLDILDRARRELYYATINKSTKKSKVEKGYFDSNHFYVVGKHANEIQYQYITPDGEFTTQSIYAMTFNNSQEASDMADRLYHDNPTYSFKAMSDSGYDVIGNRVNICSDGGMWSAKKSKHGTFTRIASDLRNLSLVEEESLTESLNDYGVNTDIPTLTMAFNMADAYTTHREEELDRRYNGDESYDASAKKSIHDTKMSFADNVSKMRVNNYAKTGNINTVMKKRD